MTDDVGELGAIRERYARRTRRYDPWDPWVMSTRHDVERHIAMRLFDAQMLPAGDRALLDMGCGAGSNLLYFLHLGFRPERLVGLDLLPERAEAASKRLPASVRVATAEASSFDAAPECFDIVFQSMMFSSVLDDGLRQAIARNMWRLVRPGGGILWYDFTWNNPTNPDVRGVRLAEIRDLFPEAKITASRTTLAPPVGRFVARVHPYAYQTINLLPFLRTHIVAWLSK